MQVDPHFVKLQRDLSELAKAQENSARVLGSLQEGRSPGAGSESTPVFVSAMTSLSKELTGSVTDVCCIKCTV